MTTPKPRPLTDAEVETLRSAMWLADVGHPPAMAKTMFRLIATIDALKARAPAVHRTAEHARLLELAKKATPGPWEARSFCQAPATDKSPAIDTAKISPLQHTALGSLKAADAAFIAACSPEVIISLVTELTEARAELGDLRVQNEGLRLDNAQWSDEYGQASFELTEATAARDRMVRIIQRVFTEQCMSVENAVDAKDAIRRASQVLGQSGNK